MKKHLYYPLAIALLAAPSVAPAMDMAAMMKQQMQESTNRMCNNQRFLSCIGSSSKKCMAAANRSIAACDSLFPIGEAAMANDGFMAHGNCMDKQITKHLGISLDRLDACDPGGAGDPMGGMPPMPGGMPPMPGGMPPTSGEMPPMGNQQGLAMMNQMMQQHAKSRGTKGVTLPVYKNATLMSHLYSEEISPMFEGAGNKPLPALSLVSPDSVKQIAKYYRKKLKGFREHNTDGQILFIKGGPKKYDVIKHTQLMPITPHVMIGPAQSLPGTPPNTRSLITIAYRK